MSVLSSSSFQLLEINIISAQDLFPVSKSIRAYAVAWLHDERKLSTQVDQVGHTNPTWNEKFVFRVDEDFLNSENAVIMIEIYTTAWLRDVLIGTVGVLVSNLLPPSTRAASRKPKLRFVALQVRRPSGRPQGILNIGVTLLDSTMRSMPLYSELSASAVGYWDLMDNKQNDDQILETASSMDSTILTLQRCQSENNDSTINDYAYRGKQSNKNVYVFSESQGSEVSLPHKGEVLNANESLCSDVGPSPSAVAAAIARGIYPVPPPPPPMMVESSTIDGWSDQDNKSEGMSTKIQRWRTELSPAFERDENQLEKIKSRQTPKRSCKSKPPRQPANRRHGLFSCFGTALGCEFSITCGGEKPKKKQVKSRKTACSALTYDESCV